MSRPFTPRGPSSSNSFVRVNGKIRAREVRVIGDDGHPYGILQLGEAINLARQQGVDLVEIAATAVPPVCRLVDFGKFRYQQSKKEKESKKHQHANKVKEVQLSPNIDPHDFSVKLSHAIDFLCEDMKVKLTLRFRGREMAHQEFGFQQVQKFVVEVAPFGHPDAPPKLIGKGINVMISPLPRAKRARHPRENEAGEIAPNPNQPEPSDSEDSPAPSKPKSHSKASPGNSAEQGGAFGHNPFSQLEGKVAPGSNGA